MFSPKSFKSVSFHPTSWKGVATGAKPVGAGRILARRKKKEISLMQICMYAVASGQVK